MYYKLKNEREKESAEVWFRKIHVHSKQKKRNHIFIMHTRKKIF